MPKISIIVPVYKVEKYLRRCLDSIANQSFTDWECILVDDGSPDNSGKICDEYAENDKRFRVFHQENAGVSAARNKGLDEAKGEWIGFVDSDDWVEPNMYEYLYNDALETKSDVVICGFVGQHNHRIKSEITRREEATKLLFDKKGFGGFSVLRLIASDLVQDVRFDTNVSYMEDNEFFYFIFKKCKKIYWDNEPLYHYERRSDSVTAQKGLTRQAKSALNMLDQLYEAEELKYIKKIILNHRLRFTIIFAYPYIKISERKTNTDFIFLQTVLKANIFEIFLNSSFSIREKIMTLIIISNSLTNIYLLMIRLSNHL